jgi:hypothetical protein
MTMPKPSNVDPYAGNILTAGLGPLRARTDVMQGLTALPPIPKSMADIPPHVALHWLMSLRDFHIPSMEDPRLYETIDLMVRQNYRYLDPSSAQTWATVSGQNSGTWNGRSPSYAAGVVGYSGTGKSDTIARCLRSYPQQVIHHESFPRLVGGHRQLVWLSVDIPASGRLVDLATDLMHATDKATGEHRFAIELARERRDGMKMLDTWLQVASAHFLGLLHLDEIQNLFKLATLKQRRGKKSVGNQVPELSIIEDQFLKWLLTLINTWQVPLLLSGTPDGMGALTRRMSTTERIVTSGFHHFQHFDDAKDPHFRNFFLPQLGKYQYVQKKLPVNDELAELVHELTGGIQRLIVALWICAQRVAIERNKGDLLLTDFRRAANTFLAPVAPAVAAFRSKDPARMSKYEDLIPHDDIFWSQLWNSVSRL